MNERDWRVLLLGGASGTGKSRLSYPLARRYQVPIVEGDYVLPAQDSFAGQAAGGRVRAVFLHEADLGRLVDNYLQREPDEGEQRSRAQVSARYGDWLAARAGEHGIPVLTARPWATTLSRLCALLDGS